MKDYYKKRSKLKSLISIMLSFAMVWTMIPGLFLMNTAYAADAISGAPATQKHLYDNGDGTYTLSLSVTGAAESSSTTEVTKANVILVLDTSSSMNANAGTTYYPVTGTPRNPAQDGNTRPTYYGLVNGEYQQLYYRNNAWRITDSNNGTVFSGQFYCRSRLWAEKNALTKDDGIIDALLKQNVAGDPVKSDIIEVSVISFDMGGDLRQSFTTNATSLKNTINGLVTDSGTNWEEALQTAKAQADSIKASQPNEDVFVIFLTDGQPSVDAEGGGGQDHNIAGNATGWHNAWNEAQDDARALVTAGYKFYSLFTWGDSTYASYLQGLVLRAYTGNTSYNYDSTIPTGSEYASYYTNASSTEALIEALNQIVHNITESVGYTNVELEDGVTSMTTSNIKTTAAGEVTNMKYYRSGGSYGTADFDKGNYGTEWTEAPHAKVVDGEVDWDLGSLVLEDGVTYTVTFVVWPSQASIDLVADLNNGVVDYDSLTDDQKSQIAVSGGHYTLKTNTDYPQVTYSTVTTTTVDGVPTTVVSDPKTATITNPDPVGLAESKLNAVKGWEDSLDPTQREEIDDVELFLKVDGNDYYVDADGKPLGVTLTEESNWTVTDYISIAPGLMVTEDSPAYDPDKPHVEWNGKQYALLETGHDYVFEESDINNHFELTAYTHHPMIMGEKEVTVDGVTTLVPDIKDVVFTKDDSGKITGIESVADMGDNLSATNTLKGGINITKKVVDENDNEIDNTDPFEVTVTMLDPEGNALPTKTTADKTEYTIDYRIYYGPNNPNYDSASGGGRSDHIYKTGTSFTETLYVGDTIRVVNVEDDTLYVVEETESAGYELDTINYTIAYGTGAATKATPVTLDGDVYYTVQGNSASYAEVVNTYTYGDLEISKTVEVDDAYAEDVANDEFTFTVKFYDDAEKTTELTDRKYKYTVYENGTATGTPGVVSSGGEIKLKDGQSAKIEKLPENAYYEVTETHASGYTTTSEGETGTIVKNETQNAEFTNTLNPAKGQIPVQKNITPAGSAAADITGKFTFTLTPVGNAPMPAGKTSLTVTSGKDGDIKLFDEITYIREGTFEYEVVESFTDGAVGGITLETTEPKKVTVTVTDNNGILETNIDPTKPLTFNNPYKTSSIDVTIPAKKIVEVPSDLLGPDPDGGTFTFTLAAGTNTAGVTTPMPKTVEQTTGATGGQITFGSETDKITFSVPGTYNYTITESGSVDGVENDPVATKNVAVVVSDKGDGTLGVTINDGEDIVFNNTYDAEPATAVIPVEKILKGDNAPDITGKFTFTLKDSNGTTVDTKTNPSAKGGKTSFKTLTFDKPDTYTYKVYESGSVEGVTNDGAADEGKTVTINVVDNKKGQLVATVSATEENPVTFTNVYNETTIQIPVIKSLVAEAGLNPPDITGKYTFTLKAGSNDAGVTTPMPSGSGNVVTNPEANGGEAKFGAITFKTEGTYHYTITESGTVDGVTNGTPLERPVTIVVKKETVEKEVTKEVTRTETEEIPAVTEEREITEQVAVKDENGEPVLDDEGNQVYETVVTGTETVVVKEATTEEKEVTEEVTETVEEEVLVATITEGAGMTFVNTYTVEPVTINFPVKKVLNKPDDTEGPNIREAYTFTLTGTSAPEGVTEIPMPSSNTVKNPDKDGGMASYGDIKYTKPGIYVYTVTESGNVPGVTNQNPATGTVTVTVTDDGSGQLTASATSTTENPLTFTNSYTYGNATLTPQVHKTLNKPEGVAGPNITGKYTFTLTAKGEAPMPTEKTVVTNPANGTADFGTISYSKPGTYEYEVTESGSVLGVVNDSEATKTFTVTVEDDKKGNLVATADYNNDLGHVLFTNEYDVVDLPVEKVWEDGDDQDGIRPAFVTVNLGGLTAEQIAEFGRLGITVPTSAQIAADADGNWEYTFTNLPKYADDGTEVTYTVDEQTTDVITGTDGPGTYDYEVTGNMTSGFTVTNTHSPEKTQIDVTKIWVDADDQDGVRPTSIVVNLIAKVGDTVLQTLSATLNEQTGWKGSFENLDVNNNGNPITYLIEEVTEEIEGIYKSVIGSLVPETDEAGNPTGNYTVDITNSHDVAKTTVKVTKAWDDANNQDGIRPTEISMQLYANEEESGEAVVLNAANNWTHTWTDLDVNAAGTPIEYTVDETAVPEGYEKTVGEVTGNAEEGYKVTITNKHVPATTELEVSKVWEDNNDEEGNRPESVTVTLSGKTESGTVDLANKYEVEVTKTLKGTEWKDAWEDLPVFDGGEEITYSVDEVAVAGYTKEVGEITEVKDDDGNVTGYTVEITNTYTPPKKTVEIKKDDVIRVDGDEVFVDDVLTYKIAYTNTTDSVMDEVTFSDTIPANTEYVPDSAVIVEDETNKGTYADGKLTWKVEKVPAGATVTATFQVKVTKVTGEPITNEGTVIDGTNTYTTNETKNPTGTPPTKDVFDADATEKTSINGNLVKEGDKLTYEVTYKNTTGKTIDTLTITDKIPENTTYVEDSAYIVEDETNKGTLADGTLTWVVENVEDGATVTATFQVTVDKNNGVAVDNTGNVRVGENGPDYDTNTTHNPTPSDPVKTGTAVAEGTTYNIDGNKVKAGDVLTYTITYKNTTGETADVELSDAVPANTTYVEGTAAVTKGEDKLDSISTDGPIVWTFKGLADGEEVTVTFKVTVGDVSGETIVNQAEVKDGDNTYTSNEVTTDTPPKKDVDNITQNTTSVDGKEVKPGDELKYTITYVNSTENVEKVYFADTIPANTTYKADSAAIEGATATPTTTADEEGKVTGIAWGSEDEPVEVPAKTTVTLTFSVTVDKDSSVIGQTIENEATANKGENTLTTNKVTNPVQTDLLLKKIVQEYVKHKADKVTFGFQVVGYDKKGGKKTFETIIGIDFTADSNVTEQDLVKNLPAETTYVEVTEVYSGGYTAVGDVTKSATVNEDGVFEVTFENKYDGFDYNTGVANKFDKSKTAGGEQTDGGGDQTAGQGDTQGGNGEN